MPRLLYRVLRYVPAVAWAVAIYFVSDQPRLPSPPFQFEGLDKLLHAAAYALLCGALLWGARRPGPRLAIGLAILAGLYGASDEWHQAHVPGREADPFDLLADFFGAVTMAGLYLRRRGLRSDRSRREEPAQGDSQPRLNRR